MGSVHSAPAAEIGELLEAQVGRVAVLTINRPARRNALTPQVLDGLRDALHRLAPISVGALGDRLDMDTGTITPLLKRLDVGGVITRTRDSADERRVLVELTTRGGALETEIRGVTDKIKSACRLTDSGVDKLRRTLETLAHPAVD